MASKDIKSIPKSVSDDDSSSYNDDDQDYINLIKTFMESYIREEEAKEKSRKKNPEASIQQCSHDTYLSNMEPNSARTENKDHQEQKKKTEEHRNVWEWLEENDRYFSESKHIELESPLLKRTKNYSDYNRVTKKYGGSNKCPSTPHIRTEHCKH